MWASYHGIFPLPSHQPAMVLALKRNARSELRVAMKKYFSFLYSPCHGYCVVATRTFCANKDLVLKSEARKSASREDMPYFQGWNENFSQPARTPSAQGHPIDKTLSEITTV